MQLVDEFAWDAWYSRGTSGGNFTLSAHDWAPAGRYLKIECLGTGVKSTDGNFFSGGEAHIQGYWRRTSGNFDQYIGVASPWNHEAWDPTMTGVIWYLQAHRGIVTYRLSIQLWA